jgi:hypothetical protein
MSCVYSLGFYVDNYKEDNPKGVSIHVKRDGMRAIHPSKYVVRSREAQRASLMNAAWNSPDLFKTGVVRAHAFPLRPATPDTWDVLLAVRFPVPLEADFNQASERDFGAIVWSGSKIVHRFNRRVRIQPLVETANLEPAFTFVEQVRVKPGEYRLTVVMNEPGTTAQHAESVTVVVPEVPRKELFVTGPTLGKVVGDEMVVYAETDDPKDDRWADPRSYAPLLVQLVDEPLDLVFLTDTCFVGSPKAVQKIESLAAYVQRDLSGEVRGGLKPIEAVPLDLDGGRKVQCQAIVDVLPSSGLVSGDFVFAAQIAGGKRAEEVVGGEVRFAVDLERGD